MTHLCAECGAVVPDSGTCRDNFEALLLLEWQIPGGPGALAHFYAVSCYGLQHPDSMNFTQETLANLHDVVAKVVAGQVTLDEIRLHNRRATNGAIRITRRPGDAPPTWKRGSWPLTITDVLTVEANTDAYTERVTEWARSICGALDKART